MRSSQDSTQKQGSVRDRSASGHTITADDGTQIVSHEQSGLSTTVANERLVVETEAVLTEFLSKGRRFDWASGLSLLQTKFFGFIITVICVAILFVAYVASMQVSLLVEVVAMVLFLLAVMYISFRMHIVQLSRSIAKVDQCVQRFANTEDAFKPHRSAVGDLDRRAEPPSSLCVTVLRDGIWRRIPFNMVVEGDVFKLCSGETFPCSAKRLAVGVRTEQDVGETFEPLQVFEPVLPSATPVPVVGSFRALSTACIPTIRAFLQSSSKKEGRTDTVFHELAAVMRAKIMLIWAISCLLTVVAAVAWDLQSDNLLGDTWRLNRWLLPVHLTLCFSPVVPVLLLQITDIWGNARVQSLFEWHAGHADTEVSKREPESADDQISQDGDVDIKEIAKADKVPLKQQIREIFEVLQHGLDGPANLMHTLNSTTVVCFCDKEGMLTDTCTTVAEVCLCKTQEDTPEWSRQFTSSSKDGAPMQSNLGHPGTPNNQRRQAPSDPFNVGQNTPSNGSSSPPIVSQSQSDPPDVPPSPSAQTALEREEIKKESTDEGSLRTVILDVQTEVKSGSGLRFEAPNWNASLASLKPLGLAMAVSRQPRDLLPHESGAEHFHALSVSDLLHSIDRGANAFAMRDCLCNVARLIGFKDDVVGSFSDVKFCLELGVPKEELSVSSSNVHLELIDQDTQEAFDTEEPKTPSPEKKKGSSYAVSAFSQTLMTWFVQDPRDQSMQMFCKAKPKHILPKCSFYFDGRAVRRLTNQDKKVLLNLVLQWKASGLVSVAYAYRPLTSPAEQKTPASLSRHSFFCTVDVEGGTQRLVPIGTGRARNLSDTIDAPSGNPHEPPIGEALGELQGEQILLGMLALKLHASVQISSYISALEQAGIRFLVFSPDGEKRTRTLGVALGLETGWNCLISLQKNMNVHTNMMGNVVLPSGIEEIKKHVQEVDNVPLLVSLFSKATPKLTQAMIEILRDNGECVTIVGSALQPNFETFKSADLSVSVLVGLAPLCKRCLGRREPLPGNMPADLHISKSLPVEFQLSADLTSLPCALQAKHSYTDGEQRTIGVLFSAIKEARRCVDCILMAVSFYASGALQLAILLFLQAVFNMPPPLEGIHILGLMLLLLPLLSIALLGNEASEKIMSEIPLKKADEKTYAQPGRLMALYALRSVPSAGATIAAFFSYLHDAFLWHVSETKEVLIAQSAENDVVKAPLIRLVQDCEGFDWTQWITGQWPKCAAALHRAAETLEPAEQWHFGWQSVLTLAQQWCGLLFVLYQLTLALTFLDRYEPFYTGCRRAPPSTMLGVSILALLIHIGITLAVLYYFADGRWTGVYIPSWLVWVVFVGVWPLVVIGTSELVKREDRKVHGRLQKYLRNMFWTRLGMWSPK